MVIVYKLFYRNQENVFLIYDGIGDLSGIISMDDDDSYKSAANIITIVIFCQLTDCTIFLSLHFSFVAKKQDVQYFKVHTHGNKHRNNTRNHKNYKNINNTIKVLIWPENVKLNLRTILCTQGFFHSKEYDNTFKITINNFSYTGLFSSHAKDFGGIYLLLSILYLVTSYLYKLETIFHAYLCLFRISHIWNLFKQI